MTDFPSPYAMRMLDLFSGELGWAAVFAARGWKVTAVDLRRPRREIPKGVEFVELDVLKICFNRQPIPHFNVLADGPNPFWEWCVPDFICASSPCEGFSTLRNFRPPVPYPELGIKLFNHTRRICEDARVRYVMENVAGAAKYVGRAVNHCGPYYLWGNAVPPILPQGISKGMTELAMGLREHKGKTGWDDRHGMKGKTPTSLVATIPPELANAVAEYAERLIEQKVSA